jgi:hypothetical protein
MKSERWNKDMEYMDAKETKLMTSATCNID